MFRSIYLKTLRDYRAPILGWGLGLGVLIAVIFAAVPQLLATPEARASLIALGPSFAWFAEPVKIDTPGGYATWKYGLTVLIVALWPMLAQSAMLRGEEERGSLDVLLSVPRTRFRVAVEKLAAMWTALLLMAVLIALLAFAGASKSGAGTTLADTILYGLNLAIFAAVMGGVALLISQFTRERRAAAGWTGGVLLVFIVVDMVHRVVTGTNSLSQLSPVYYYNLSKPLIEGYGANAGAMALLVGLAVLFNAAGIWLFVRRDAGDVVAGPKFLRRPARETRPAQLPVNDWSLRSVYMRGLAMVAVPTFWWTIAIAGFASWFVVIVKQTETQLSNLLKGSPLGHDILKAGGGSDAVTNASILSAVYIFLPLMLMAFAVTQANRWAADEEEGRLDLVLATPHRRGAVLLGRFAALGTATAVVSLITLASTELASIGEGISLDTGNLAAATLSMIPLALLVAALGYALSGWMRAAVDTGLISFVLVIWFVVSFIGPGLNWPETTLRLSAFYYYGTPLLHGLDLGNLAVIVAVGSAALVIAMLRFNRKDIAV